jgi:small-conductance mechanosensitive channel
MGTYVERQLLLIKLLNPILKDNMSWQDFSNFTPHFQTKHFTGVLILILIYLLTRFLLVRLVTNWSVQDKDSRKNWYFIAKRLPSIMLFIGVLFIWGSELRDLALSLVAVAAAVVIATKEVILCFMGGLLKVSTNLFEIGDRISVGGCRGKVIEHTLLTTTLLEIGPGPKSNQNTGRLLKLPNSHFLTHTVTVVPSDHDFILHVITINMPVSPYWEEMENFLKDSAVEVFSTYKHEFDKYAKRNRELVKSHALDQEPRVIFELNSKDTIEFQVRLTIPYAALSKTESLIARTFLKKLSHLEVYTRDHSH